MTEEIKKTKVVSTEKTAVETTLEKIQADMEAMKKANEAKDKQIEMLTEIANESRKVKWEEKNLKNKIVSIVNLSTIDGKVITSWRTVIDEVFKNASGDWTENQVHEYIDEDGTKILVNLTDKARKIVKIPAEVLSVAVDQEEEGKDDTVFTTYIYKVKTKDGKEYQINSRFIN